MHIEAITFDLDDTLFSRRSAFRGMWNELIVQNGIATGDGDGLTKILDEIEEWGSVRVPGSTVIENKLRLFRLFSTRYPQVTGTPDEFVEQWNTGMLKHVFPAAGLADLQLHLNRSKIPWAIITNGDDFQYRKIEILDIDISRDHVIAGDIVGFSKPDPRIFQMGMNVLGQTDPSKVLMVGDQAEADIRGAQNIGMQTAWMKNSSEWSASDFAPDFQLETLSDLLEII